MYYVCTYLDVNVSARGVPSRWRKKRRVGKGKCCYTVAASKVGTKREGKVKIKGYFVSEGVVGVKQRQLLSALREPLLRAL